MKRINCEMNLTLRCNAQCKNCNRHCDRYPDRGEEEDMTVEQISRFIDQIADSPIKVKRLKLLGGEPLLHPDFEAIYFMLAKATDDGLIQKIKIESNGIIPHPHVGRHDNIRWAGKPFKRKKHLPVLWSPTDMGLETPGCPCSMPRICGISLDAYGYSLCSMCPMMLRIFQCEEFYALYADEFPGNWQEVFVDTIKTICPHCIFSASQEFKDQHCYPVTDTPEHALKPTETWQLYLDEFDGHAKKGKW